jgi:hypothetical protein
MNEHEIIESLDGWIGSARAAKIIGISNRHMRNLCSTNQILALKLDNQWYIRRSDANNYVRKKHGPKKYQLPSNHS